MSSEPSNKRYVLTKEQFEEIGFVVDYLHGLRSLANDGTNGSTITQLFRENFAALIKPACDVAERVYCEVIELEERAPAPIEPSESIQ